MQDYQTSSRLQGDLVIVNVGEYRKIMKKGE
jgi:hypothetical protein